MTAEEVLVGAADILEQKGWLQSKWTDEEGRCCLVGAIALADPTGSFYSWTAARKAVQREVGTDDLITWNNTRGRVKEEVISALRNSKRWL